MTLFKGEGIREVTVELRGKDTLAKRANKNQMGMEKKRSHLLRRGSLGWMESGLGCAEEGLLSYRITYQTTLDPVVGVTGVVVTSYQQFSDKLGDLAVIIREGHGEKVISRRGTVSGSGNVMKVRSNI